jgi:flagellar basal-body rod protein FlgG
MDVTSNYAQRGEDDLLMLGHGVKLHSIDLLYNQGTLQATDRALDFAIVGEGLFAVERRGRVEYTRNGAFGLSVEADGNFVVTGDGAYVLDANLQPVRASYDPITLELDSTATGLSFGIFEFPNPYGLQKIDATSFLPTAISGEAQAIAEVGINGQTQSRNQLFTRTLEYSNVNLAKEMADLIVTQKAYQFSARVVSVADELEGVVNNLRS